MTVDPNLLAQVAQRWNARAGERERARSERAGAPAEVATRHRQRLERLSRAATEEKARGLVLAADRASEGRGTPRVSLSSTFAMERVVGKSDLLDFNFLELAIAVARSVGRIRMGNSFGTGFLVSPALLLTNYHVLRSPDEALRSVVDFDYQESRSRELLPVETFTLDPRRFFLASEPLDFALVAVAPESGRGTPLSGFGWVKLIAEQGKAEMGDCLNIIQHPLGQLKQIALRENEVVDIFDHYVHYVTDTEPGSSGSPCFNDQWELVALHHSGVPKIDGQGRLLKRGGGIWKDGEDAPAELDWVANEGIRVSSIVAEVGQARLDAEQKRLREEMLEAPPPNPIELAQAGEVRPPVEVPAPAIAAQTAGQTVTWTIPLRVTMTLGAASAEWSATVAPPAAAEPLERLAIDPDYAARQGYDADFLPDLKVPLPVLCAATKRDALVVDPAAAGDKKYVLKYHHFSVVINKRRRMACCTAVNIDGARKQDLGKRQDDRWCFDPRIPSSAQIGDEAYAGNVLDKGHLVRRLDPAWGASVTAARKANDDTFHYTNCAPQHKDFNRNNATWQGLEDYLLGQAQGSGLRVTVFTGPVLRATDPRFQGGRLSYAIRIPLEYWKVAVLVKAGGLPSATGYLLSQSDLIGDAGDLEERFVAGTFQVPISDIEKRAGLDFGALRNYDPLDRAAEATRLETMPGAAARLLAAPDQIVL